MTSLGIVLLVLGAAVAVAEAHVPTHGIAGGSGVLMMAAGVVLAITGLGGGLAIGLLAGGVLATAGAGGVALAIRSASGVRHLHARSGAETMIGRTGTVRSWAEATGKVAVDGALWRACRSPSHDEHEERHELHAGDTIVVERMNGLTLSVRPAEEWELLT
jgi:membrane-bound serine protease (ClpP class)